MSRGGRGGSKRGGGRGGRRGRTPAASDLEARVLQALGESPRGPLKTKELARQLAVPPEEYRAFRRLLQGLERRGTVYRLKGHRYGLAGQLDLAAGPVAVTRDGHGFVRGDDGRGDVFVPAHRLGTAMDGDHVVARIERRPSGRSREGTVVRVLERARDRVVGTLHRGRKVTYVSPLDRRLRKDVLVTRGDEGDADDGDVVVLRLTSYGEGSVGPTGRVEEVLGRLDDPGVDVLALAHGFGLGLDFDEHVRQYAEHAAHKGVDDGGADRIDRTELLAFTVDPADAKDHDDALSVTSLPDGKLEVGVHIADVSHFVASGSPVDVEAHARGTSVYLVDRTIPMLPAVLSNDACSLNPGVPKHAVSLFLVMDREGQVHERRYERTTIQCDRALAYEEAQAVLDGRASISPEIDDALRTLDDVARSVRTRRRERGSLDLDLPEAKVVLDADGLPVDITRRERLESHRLVEDLMILANEAVAADLEAAGVPGMYRVHEPPSPEKVEAMAETLSRFGVKLARRKRLKPRDLQSVLDEVRGREVEALVNGLVLRSLAKARYDTENLGHFGLASSGYVHFTSPIRRYPDLVVHRVVTDVLIHGRPTPYDDPVTLEASAERCSARERAAEEAERASVALKKVEYMERHIGDSFFGRISGVAAFGFFVTLDQVFVEGLVHVSSLHDDYYHFLEKELALVGERGRRRLRLGDRVEVQVARADKEARQIDFVLLRTLPRRPRKLEA